MKTAEEISRKAAHDRQMLIDASKIQAGSTAEQTAFHLCNEILKYQKSLSDSEDVSLMYVQFNQSCTILVTGIGYSGYNLVCFHGLDTSGNPVELIQHVQQLNFLLTAVKKTDPHEPKRKIGFVGQVN